jgi:hypothetical protein
LVQRQQGKGGRRKVTAELVWQAMPPLGGRAYTTGEVAEQLGVLPSEVLPFAHRLAEQGRAQRLHRDGAAGLEWRRQ